MQTRIAVLLLTSIIRLGEKETVPSTLNGRDV
jgi:hypothetical protein